MNHKKLTTIRFLGFILIAVFLTAIPLYASAAQLFFGTEGAQMPIHRDFEIGFFVNSEGETINTIAAEIQLPANLKLKEIRDGDSIINFWIERAHSKGCSQNLCTIAFSGIVPGGYNGKFGHLFSFIVQSNSASEVMVRTSNESVLLNDGKGTSAVFHSAPLKLTLSETASTAAFLPPYDAEPPESFSPQVTKDSSFFDNKLVLVFATQDKISGIDHYEVKEQGILGGSWKVAESPYVLADQQQTSDIFIKAVDRAHNERVVEIPALVSLPWYANQQIWAIIISILLVISVILFAQWAKQKK